MALNVIMMGAPGAGKGTQAERLARDRGLLKISTGDILREAVQAQTPLGLKAKATIAAGRLVDDETMIGIVRERLFQPDAMCGFVLDGFPRTTPQAEALDTIMADRHCGPLVIVKITVPPDELVRRLTTRRICGSCGFNADPFGTETGMLCARCGGQLVQRADDSSEAVVLNRLRVYERDTKPLVDYYSDRPTFRVIDGARPPEEVAHELNDWIEAAIGKESSL